MILAPLPIEKLDHLHLIGINQLVLSQILLLLLTCQWL